MNILFIKIIDMKHFVILLIINHVHMSNISIKKAV